MGSPNLIPVPREGDQRGIVRALAKLASLRLNADSTPTFASLTLTSLTASRLLATDSDKTLISSDLINWVDGTADEIEIADDGDGTITIGIVDPLIVNKGGTGAASLTDHAILLGSGTGSITPLGEATDGQIPIGSTGADPVLSTITGTTNQVNISNGSGSITLSTPQDIHTGATPTFADLLLTDFDSTETVAQILNDTVNPGVLDTVTVSDDGGRDISWTAGELYPTDGNVISVSSGNTTCTDNAVNYLVWDSGTTLTLQTSIPDDTQVGVAKIAVAAGDIWEINEEPVLNRVVYRMQQSLEETFPLVVNYGLVVSEDTDATNAFDVVSSAGEYHRDVHNRHVVSQIQSRVTPMRRWYHSGGAWTNDTNAEIDNTQYDNGTNLTALSAGRWVKSLFLISSTEIHWIYPQEEFSNLNAALLGALPSLPSGLEAFPKSTVLILKQGDTSLPAPASDQWIDIRPLLGLEQIVGGVIITEHSSLAGLTDDDHPQYLLVDGTRAMSGNLDMGNQNIINPGTGHDAFTDFVANEHIDHSGVSISSGGILSGGGAITESQTISLAQADIYHDQITNTHNLTTDIDHDLLTNFSADEHFLQTAITNVSTALATGLLKVTTGTGALSVITDSSTDWDTAYSHSQLTSGNPHSVTPAELSLVIGTNTQAWDAGLDSLAGLTYSAASFVKMTGANTFALRTIEETADDLEGTIQHDNLASPTIAAHDTTATGANLTTLTDNSITNALHRHSELVASDGSVDPAISVDSAGQTNFFGNAVLKRDVDDAFGFGFRAEKSRAGGAVQNSDLIANYRWSGHDGTSIREGAELDVRVDGVPGTGDMPMRMIFKTSPAGSASAAARMTIKASGKIGINETDPKTILTIGGALTLKEQAAADGDTAAYGQLWVKNDTPNVLMFTNDVGTDSQIQAHGDVLDDLNALGAVSSDGQFLVGTGAGTFAYESGDTARTSLGVGMGDSPAFAALELKERAAAQTNTVAYGQIWVKNDTPNVLMFTDDTGVDYTVNVTAV